MRLVAPNGQNQWVGCVLRERNDAFDLTVALSDFVEKRDREKNPTKYKDQFSGKTTQQ